jgi:hypothetical protein
VAIGVLGGDVTRRYRFVATHLGTPFTKIAELHVSGVSWQRLRNGAGVFRGSVKLPPPLTPEARTLCALYREATDRGTTCLYVIRDNVPMAAYAIWGQDYSSESQTISISGSELTSYLHRRIIESGDGDLDTRVSYEGEPMYDAVTAMIGQVNDIGLTLDVASGGPALPVTTPATADGTPEVKGTGWRGTDGKVVGTAIDELANQDDGFDYRVDLVRDSGNMVRRFVLRPTFAGEVALVAKFGATGPRFHVRRRGDVRASDVIAVGASNGEKRPYGRATGGSFTPPLQVVQQANDEADTGRLDAFAQAALNAAQADEILEVEVAAEDIDAQVGTFSPGDRCRFVVEAGRDPWFADGTDRTIDTIGYTVNVPDTGGRETIALQLPAEGAGA